VCEKCLLFSEKRQIAKYGRLLIEYEHFAEFGTAPNSKDIWQLNAKNPVYQFGKRGLMGGTGSYFTLPLAVQIAQMANV
jgi:hypothetical protein